MALKISDARNAFPPYARQFGLQSLLFAVQHHWDDYAPDERAALKSAALQLLASGTLHMLTEAIFVKEKLVRLIVEIIKRDWPQRWPTLFADLTQACALGVRLCTAPVHESAPYDAQSRDAEHAGRAGPAYFAHALRGHVPV